MMNDVNAYRKSSYSNAECVEARELPDGSVEVRNSRLPDHPQKFTRSEWIAFVVAVKEGEFDFGLNTDEERARLLTAG